MSCRWALGRWGAGATRHVEQDAALERLDRGVLLRAHVEELGGVVQRALVAWVDTSDMQGVLSLCYL